MAVGQGSNLMKNLAPMFVAAAAACLIGCVPSLHPIYTPDNVVFEPRLEGKWVTADGDESWVFTAENDRGYDLLYTDSEDKEGRFEVYLTRADGVTFLDLYPREPDLQSACLYRCLLVPVHTFLKADLEGDQLTLAVADIDWLEEHLEAHPDALAHERMGEGFLLTAQPEALRSFFAGLAKQGKGFGEPMPLRRK
jgi:hypothetical protein